MECSRWLGLRVLFVTTTVSMDSSRRDAVHSTAKAARKIMQTLNYGVAWIFLYGVGGWPAIFFWFHG